MENEKFHRLRTTQSETFYNHCRSCAFVGYAINSLALSIYLSLPIYLTNTASNTDKKKTESTTEMNT